MTASARTITSEAARQHAAHLARRRRMQAPLPPAVQRIVIAEAPEADTSVVVRTVTPEPPVLIGELRAPRGRVTLAAVKRVVCAEFGITAAELESHQRGRRVVVPRQAAMLIASRETTATLCEIGRRLGGRDHTTVMHGIARMKQLIGRDAELARRIARCTALLRAGAGREAT